MATATEPSVEAAPAGLESLEPAVVVDHVTVHYSVPHEAIQSLKEYVIRKIKRGLHHTELLALKDVSFRIQPGERVGVIGSNGAGKSTLFRVIARVRRPTTGRVVVRGRVAPLLELGLGFHGELTGRENIILQGALMGFSHRQMLERIPRIAAFAELEPFLDFPIRKYSTGMSARLAFAVATDVDPDILLVDEALAVGDERFRAKCHERMAHFRERGRTFLLVSHALGEVEESCQRTLWIANGRLVQDGPSIEVCAAYREWSKRLRVPA